MDSPGEVKAGQGRTRFLAFLFISALVGGTQLVGQATPWYQAPGFRATNGNPEYSIPKTSVGSVTTSPSPNMRPSVEQTRHFIDSHPAFSGMDSGIKNAIIYGGTGSGLLNGPYLPNGVQNPFFQNGKTTPNWYIPATWSSPSMNWQGVQPNGFLPTPSSTSFYGGLAATATYNPTTSNRQYQPPSYRPYQPPPMRPTPQPTQQSPPKTPAQSLPSRTSQTAQPTTPITFSPSATDLAKARANGERALALSETAGDKIAQAINHAALAQVLAQQGQVDVAFTQLRAAEALSEATVDPAAHISLLRAKGAVYMATGDFENAIRAYQESLSLLPASADKVEQAEIRTSIGWAYQSAGEIALAMMSYKEAQALFAEAGNRDGKVRTGLAIGSLYASIGEPEKAIDQYRSIAREASNKQFARMLISNAEMCQSVNEHGEALKRYKAALSLIEPTAKNPFPVFLAPWQQDSAATDMDPSEKASLEISIRAGIGRSLMALGLLWTAKDSFEQALTVAKTSGNQAAEAGIIASIGELAYWKAIGDAKLECSTTSPFLSCRSTKTQFSDALHSYNEALSLMQTTANRIGEIGILTNTGLTYDAQEDHSQALRYYKQALQQMDALERGARLEEFRINIASQSAGLYERTIELEASQHHMEESFNLSERARARTLLDQLGNPRIDLGKNAPVDFLDRERKLRQENITLRRQLGQELSKPGPEVNIERTRSIQARLEAVRSHYENAVSELKLSNPEYASFLSIAPLTLREAQQQLDRDVTVLSYFTTPRMTFAFVLTRESFHAERIPVTADRLSRAIATFEDFAGESDDSPALRFLYNSLIAPIKGKLKTAKLIVVPHGALHDLPFAALTPDGKSYLNDHYAIAYLPSVSILPYVRSRIKPAGTNALVLANNHEEGVPYLNHAYDEARAVASLLGTQPLMGADATPSALRARAGEAAIVHVIAHFDLDQKYPRSTRILLGQDQKNDEPLDLNYVANLNLRKTNLVVLSGCQTQVGKRSRGDDVVGLSRAFMYAGAPSVVASLWSVDDDATQRLMIAFYMHLNEGLGKAEALRAAQRDVRRYYLHPYYWAGFVLMGDPGGTGNSLEARTIR